MNYVKGNNSQDDAHNSIVLVSTGDSIFKDLSDATSFDMAIEFYDKAIKADSTFALAFAKRSITRSWGCRAGHFTSKEDMEKCRYDAEHAVMLDKALTEAGLLQGSTTIILKKTSTRLWNGSEKYVKKSLMTGSVNITWLWL